MYKISKPFRSFVGGVVPPGLKIQFLDWERKRKFLPVTNIDNQYIGIHLGCGTHYLQGYINVDLSEKDIGAQGSRKLDLVADVKHLHLKTESVNEIRSRHLFEHFDRVDSMLLLIEWQEWLKPGGSLYITTPDIEKALIRLSRHNSSIHEQFVAVRHIFGSHEAKWAFHIDGWYWKKFKYVLGNLGYTDISYRRTSYKYLDHITVKANKPSPSMSIEAKFAAASHILKYYTVDQAKSERIMLDNWRGKLLHAKKNYQNCD